MHSVVSNAARLCQCGCHLVPHAHSCVQRCCRACRRQTRHALPDERDPTSQTTGLTAEGHRVAHRSSCMRTFKCPPSLHLARLRVRAGASARHLPPHPLLAKLLGGIPLLCPEQTMQCFSTLHRTALATQTFVQPALFTHPQTCLSNWKHAASGSIPVLSIAG